MMNVVIGAERPIAVAGATGLKTQVPGACCSVSVLAAASTITEKSVR